MSPTFLQEVLFLTGGIAIIVLLTAKYRVHAFFALLIACFFVGLGVQIPTADIVSAVKEGFGNIMRSLGLIIVLGTTLGVILEHTGASRVMADFILRLTGEKRAALGISITGFIVGLPIFCDSGYIVLSGLNQSLAKRTGIPVIIMSVSMATALLSVHCLIPPHPGASAAAVTIGVDFGKLIMAGIIVAIPAMLTGYWWAGYAGRKIIQQPGKPVNETSTPVQAQPSIAGSFLPVVIPIFLIALKSFFATAKAVPQPWLINMVNVLGDPVMALSAGVLLAFATGRSWNRDSVGRLLQDSAEKAGGILVIIGAGGGFGAVLAASHIGVHFSQALALGSMGILFPFLLTFILKTAQGSSTVAIITASSIVAPLLPALGLGTDTGKLLCVLSMGAGSMMISHANDAYFWVIAKFSGLDMKPMLKVYSTGTLFMGLAAFTTVWVLSLLLR
jgi:GntP family gluconate:H+ symporter